jgi:hypothetical protein
MKWSRNFNQFGNCNKKFGLDDDGIEQHEIGRCGFDQNIKWYEINKNFRMSEESNQFKFKQPGRGKSLTLNKCQRHVQIFSEWDIN